MSVFKTNEFTGGMNDWLHAGLLKENTASLLVDAKTENGKINAVNLPGDLQVNDPEKYGHYGTRNRSVVKWYGRYYWSENERNAPPYFGGNVEGLGVPYPEIQPELEAMAPDAGENGLSGDYKYCLCFVNDNGWEGAPGSLTEYYTSITLENQKVKVTSPVFPDGISYAKVYRTGNQGADFYCVGRINESGGFLIDNEPDIDLPLLEPMTSTDNYPPPDKGRYLTESGGVFFLAVGDRVYFSVQGNPHAWPTLNFIGIGNAIKGITPEFQGVLVFTENNSYRVTGAESAETITKALIPGNQGCINYRSIAHLVNSPIWLSNDGICVWNGESINIVNTGTLKAERLPLSYAVSANEVYYLFLTDGCIAFDHRQGNIFYRLSFTCDYAWYDENSDRLYLQKGKFLYEFGIGEKSEYKYISPYIGGTDLTIKKFYELLITCSEPFILTVLLEDAVHFTEDIKTGGRKRIKFPFTLTGQYMQLQIQSKGELSEIAVGYE